MEKLPVVKKRWKGGDEEYGALHGKKAIAYRLALKIEKLIARLLGMPLTYYLALGRVPPFVYGDVESNKILAFTAKRL